jgi:glutamate/tyrosine decarboxylase-like PLP-dependent enzyme
LIAAFGKRFVSPCPHFSGIMTQPPAHAALRRAFDAATEWIDGVDHRSVAATASADELRARMRIELDRGGVDPARVIDELVTMTRGGLHASVSGRFFAWVIGGTLPAALAADWLTSAWDQNAAIYSTAPAAAVVEEVAGAWLLDVLDLPRDASFAFTTGCQLAHFTALAAARHAVLSRAGWNLQRDGMFGAPAMRVITSEHRHGSVDRAIRFLGIGTSAVRALDTNRFCSIEPHTLSAALAEYAGPTIVVLDAADLNVGAFDDFAALVPLAQSFGAWVHIDGAFGLIARASASKRLLLNGVQLADSWATDAHKWLNVPQDCGFAAVRDREAHRAAMTHSASYIDEDTDVRSQIDWNPEWSRRSRGFAVFAALRELGRDGLEALIDRTCAHCHALVTGIGALEGAEMVWEPRLNQGLVRFLDGRAGATTDDHDRRTDEVIARVNASGEAFFSGTKWQGRRAMRVSVVNWRTNDSDVGRTIAAIAAVLRAG